MPSSVHCPKAREIKPMSNCTLCGSHVKNGTSLEWCKFKIEIPKEENALKKQIELLTKRAENYYKTGKTKLGDNCSIQAAKLEIQIRRRQNEH